MPCYISGGRVWYNIEVIQSLSVDFSRCAGWAIILSWLL